MSQSPTSTHAPAPAPAPEATKKPRDKARDQQMLLALLVTDWLHGDRHHQARLMELALEMLTDLGDDGAEAKARLTGERFAPAPAPALAKAA